MYAASDWYHIATTPDGMHVHYLDPDKLVDRAREYMLADSRLSEENAIAMAVGYYSEAIRKELGFPLEFPAVSGWSCAAAPGRPDKLLQTATLHEGLPEGAQQQ